MLTSSVVGGKYITSPGLSLRLGLNCREYIYSVPQKLQDISAVTLFKKQFDLGDINA